MTKNSPNGMCRTRGAVFRSLARFELGCDWSLSAGKNPGCRATQSPLCVMKTDNAWVFDNINLLLEHHRWIHWKPLNAESWIVSTGIYTDVMRL